MAGTLGCGAETLRRYLRQLAARRLIIKNQGNATNMNGTAGITVALGFPEGIREALEPHLNPPSRDPPISAQTGIPIPPFHDKAGWNPSRSPYSHEGEGEWGPTGGKSPGEGAGPAVLQGCPKLTRMEGERLVPWLPDLPDAIAVHCRGMAEKKGLSGTLGRLIDVLEFAAGKMDRVALHLVMEDVARWISFRGKEKPRADLASMTSGDCLQRFLRKLVFVLGEHHQLADTPGYEAIKRRSQFVKPRADKPVRARPDYAAVTRGDAAWDDLPNKGAKA